MVPDRLPEPLRSVIARFPPGALQFEIGIQTFNEEVGGLIKRRQNYQRLEENFRFLRGQTGVHLHADPHRGSLPGESLEKLCRRVRSVGRAQPKRSGWGSLSACEAPLIVRPTPPGNGLNPAPPYEILQNKLIDFFDAELAPFCPLLGPDREQWKLRRNHPIALDPWRVAVSGLLLRWSEWLHDRVGRTRRKSRCLG
jgi:hypothetical protein